VPIQPQAAGGVDPPQAARLASTLVGMEGKGIRRVSGPDPVAGGDAGGNAGTGAAGSGPLTAAEALAGALRTLHASAGKPEYRALVAQGRAQRPPVVLNEKTISDWLGGVAVPASGQKFRFLVEHLRQLAVRRGHEPPPPGWWDELYAKAVDERRGQRGGRPRKGPADGDRARRVQVGVIPRLAQCFQERSAVRILDAAGGDGPVPRCQVLVGTGGVGKTQLAARHAAATLSSGTVDVLVWVTATSPQAIVATYAEAAAQLLGEKGGRSADQAAAAFLSFLAHERDRRWLVVLDDVARAADLSGLWPPDSPGGSTLVTTRNRDAVLVREGRSVVEIGLFREEESAAYLAAKLAAHRRQEDPDELAALAEDLGHLPLALSQAVPYLVNKRLDCAAYRRRLADRRRTLPTLMADISGLPDDQRLTVAAAWSLSIELADELQPRGLARPMLRIAAMLDPNGIPNGVLTGAAARRWLGMDSDGDRTAVTADDAADALWNLHQLSLVDYEPGPPVPAVRVHQLIQRAVREELPPDRADLAIGLAGLGICDAWPSGAPDAGTERLLRANAVALQRREPERGLYLPDMNPVLFVVGDSLGESGQIRAAIAHFAQVSGAGRRLLGADHPHSMQARAHLARWQGTSGDAAGAAAEFGRLFIQRQRVLGPRHPDTLSAQARRLRWLAEASGLSEAIRLAPALLDVQCSVLGPEHKEVLSLRANLANWRGMDGDVAGATAGLRELLADRTRVLGPDDARTLSTRNSLAYWLRQAGEKTRALGDYESLLEDQQRVLGPNHPDVIITRSNLAQARGEAGDPAGAAASFAELLRHALGVLEADHPYTLVIRKNLAHWWDSAGDADGAAAAYEGLFTATARVFGPLDKRTLDAMADLGRYRANVGRFDEALEVYRELRDRVQESYGPDHRWALATLESIANVQALTGRNAETAADFAELHRARAQVLGADAEETLNALGGVARYSDAAGDFVTARSAFQELAERLGRLRGTDDRTTLVMRHNAAVLLHRLGGHDAAEAALAEVLAARQGAFGRDDPDTAATRATLDRLRALRDAPGIPNKP
jgi:tetratricopeptide (TPR) repeat protein